MLNMARSATRRGSGRRGRSAGRMRPEGNSLRDRQYLRGEFCIGCVLGYVYYKTGSLKLTMLMHFTNNTFALILGHIDSLEDMDSYRDLFPGPEFWLILVGCVLLLALGLMFYQQVKLLKPQGNCDEVPPIFES